MNLFSAKWWVGSLVTAFMTMFFIYLVKVLVQKTNVPFLQKVTEGAYN
ncbi:hypothetical protein [Bacillus wiedmannii]|nr:hypothetical protein [Bacillus wiedmannii]